MKPGTSLDERPTSANVARALDDVTAAYPDRSALLGLDGRRRYTFAELAERATRVALGLARRGLRPGGRVALLIRDPEEVLIVAVATLWAGGTVVAPPMSGGWQPALRAVNRTRPTAVVADPTTWLALAAAPGLLGVRIRVITGRRRWPAFVTLDDLADDAHVVAAGPRVPSCRRTCTRQLDDRLNGPSASRRPDARRAGRPARGDPTVARPSAR